MPFTPSHAALVLPLIRINPRHISATGLIIGSMAPDFEYFFRMSSHGEFGHTLAGLFLFDLPVSAVLAFVFHGVVKHKLISHLPIFLQKRLQSLRQLDFVAYFSTHAGAFVVSALLGAASHIFWDGFTHGDGYFIKHLPAIYQHRYVPYDGVRYPLWYALQNISSYVGLTVVIIYILCLKPQAGEVYPPAWWYWCFVLLITLLVVGVRFEFEPARIRLGDAIIASISGLCIAVVLAGIIPVRAASGYR